MIEVPRFRLPVGPARIARRYRRRLAGVYCPGVGSYDLADADGAVYTQGGTPLGVRTGILGLGQVTSSSTSYINRSRAISLPASTNYTCLFAVDAVVFTGSNPGVWRNANEFCIFQGTTGRPWLRANGFDVFRPLSGYGITAGASHVFAFRFRTAVDTTFFCDGAIRHNVTHSTNNGAASVSIYGYQTASEGLGGGYSLCAFWLDALSDGELCELTGNPGRLFEGFRLPGKAPAGNTIISLALASLGFTRYSAQPALSTPLSAQQLQYTENAVQPKVAVGLSAPTLNQDGATHNTSVSAATTSAQLSWSAKALTFFQATLVQLSAATLRFTSYAIEATGAVAAAATSRYYTLRRFLGRR